MVQKMAGRGIACLGLLLGMAVGLSAEERTLEETLETLTGDAAAAYVAPISSAFGANLNSGWFRRAPQAKKVGFNFEAGLVIMGSFFPTDADHFSVTGDFRFSESEAAFLVEPLESESPYPALWPLIEDQLIDAITAQEHSVGISGATVVGAMEDSITVNFGGQGFDVNVAGLDTTFYVDEMDVKLPFGGFGDLAEVNVLPLTVPQISLGTVFGTQFTLRMLPAVELNEDLGEYSYTGFGIQHNPAVWMKKELPVDLALSFFTQTMEVGTLFKSKATAYGLTASKQFGWRFLNLTPYAGFLIEDASMDVGYTLQVPVPVSAAAPDGIYTESISLELESENTTRFSIGANIRLALVNWNFDYSFAKYNAFSTGISFAL